MEPDNPIFYSNRSAAYFHLEEFEHALADAETSFQLDTEYTKAAYRKAMALYELDNLEVTKISYKGSHSSYKFPEREGI